MKTICRLLLVCLILFTSGCAAQQHPSPQGTPSSSPTSNANTPTQAVSTATATPTAAPTSTQRISETPTVFAFSPEPTPLPPDLSRLQVINRTNLKQITLVWRFEPSSVNSGKDIDSIIGFSPGGNNLLFIQKNKVYRMEITTRKIIYSYSLDKIFPGDEQPIILNACFNPDGSKIAGLTPIGPVLWDTQSTEVLWTADWGSAASHATDDASAGLFSHLVFSPDGAVLVTTATMANSDTRVWSTASGRLIKVLGRGDQLDAQFSRDGKYLYTADQFSTDEAIRIWSTESWEQVGHVRIEAGARSLEVSNSGEILAVGSSGSEGSEEIDAFRIRDWTLLGRIKGHTSESAGRSIIEAGPALNIDSGILAYIAKENGNPPNSTIQFNDPDFLTPLFSIDFSLPETIRHLSFSPNGKLLALQGEHGTTLFYGVLAN